MQADRPSDGPLPGVVGRWAGAAASPVYRAVVAWRNHRFDRGIGVSRVGVAVVSVGNLSVGGTGKTPMVRYLARVLGQPARGERKVAVALRGYRAGRHGLSDEAEEYRRLLPGVEVLVGADRRARIEARLLEADPPEVVLLDDGFQHRQLHRDLDIVLVDATRNPYAGRLLPAGWLREPVSALGRAGVIVLTHAEAAPAAEIYALKASVAREHPRAVLAVARHVWAGLYGIPGESSVEARWLQDRRVVVACAIGNPGPFLERCGAEARVVGKVLRPDHAEYDERTLRRLIGLAQDRGAEAIVTTEKDWSKLSRVTPGRWPCPVVRPRVEVRFDEGEEALAGVVMGAIGPGRLAADTLG